GHAGASNHDGQVTSKARRSGQIMVESQRGHRHRAWWSSTQEHRNDTDGPTFLRGGSRWGALTTLVLRGLQ
ncbi:MAG TPA: hypothetical protein VJS67_02380, partial [Pseudonocardiaceae bacterium]|nr:hypothetical protein [Pseudonocardiaceae bacterium]